MRTRRTQTSSNQVSANRHQSVLLHEVIDGLVIHPSDVVVDATAGSGGHSRAIAEKLDTSGTLIAIDADSGAVKRTEEALAKAKPTVHVVQKNFRDLEVVLAELNIAAIDKALFDLGWSANQLESGRGFSFQKNEPLLMTYQEDIKPETLTAAQVVNEWEEEHIADILWGWGEEKFSRKIARAIKERRKEKPFETSGELADLIAKTVPAWYRHKKIHPATKTFQALRIAVNDEMGATAQGLEAARLLLNPHGRIAVVTFHSIEDRLVKRTFLAWQKADYGQVVTKKPIAPSRDETLENPRARSAKLRIFEKHT